MNNALATIRYKFHSIAFGWAVEKELSSQYTAFIMHGLNYTQATYFDLVI